MWDKLHKKHCMENLAESICSIRKIYKMCKRQRVYKKDKLKKNPEKIHKCRSSDFVSGWLLKFNSWVILLHISVGFHSKNRKNPFNLTYIKIYIYRIYWNAFYYKLYYKLLGCQNTIEQSVSVKSLSIREEKEVQFCTTTNRICWFVLRTNNH